MFRALNQDQSGVILVTVLIIVAVMSILAIGILSMQVSRVQSGQDVVNDIQAEYWGRQLLWEIYANNLNGIAVSTGATITIDGTLFTAVITDNLDGTFDIDISY